MTKAEQDRLNLLFEMETIKTPLMNYIAPGLSIKIVTDLGAKDQNGNKRRFYEEVRYKSNKYKNTDYLTSSTMRFETYLLIEYPNVYCNDNNSSNKSKILIIRPYAIDDIVDTMRQFNKYIPKCFSINNNSIVLLADKVKNFTVNPSMNTELCFSSDIFETRDGRREVGVRITINNEYSVTISAETTWPELFYRFKNCNLTTIGLQMVQSYLALLPGMAVSEFGDKRYTSTSRYSPWSSNEDPDEIINNPNSIGGTNNPKYMSPENKKKSFFSDD